MRNNPGKRKASRDTFLVGNVRYLISIQSPDFLFSSAFKGVLQREAGGQVVPDSFTHGTSAQRVKWFRKGFESGDMGVCNTFQASQE